MTAHLSDLEFVDLVDGRLPAARSAHVDTCVECSERAAAMRDLIITVAAGASVPEPSPLFWEHFSARVGAAVAADRPAHHDRWLDLLHAHAWRRGVAIAFGIFVLVAVLWRGSQPPMPSADGDAMAGAGAVATPPGTDDIWNEDIESDEAWSVVRTVADDVGWDETTEAGIAAAPQSAERVVPQLSEEERSELARLLQEELRRIGA